MSLVKGKESGQAVAGFAVILPVIILLFFGSMDLMSLVNARSQLIQCANATGDYVSTNYTVPLQAETEAETSVDGTDTGTDARADATTETISFTKDELESGAKDFVSELSVDGSTPEIESFTYFNGDTGVTIKMKVQVPLVFGILKLATGKNSAIIHTEAPASIRLSN